MRSASAARPGKWVSRPDPASRGTHRRHRLRPFAHQQEQHARPGGELPLHRLRARWLSEPRLVGDAMRSAARTRICRPTSPSPIRAACRRTGSNNWGPGFLPAAFQGTTDERQGTGAASRAAAGRLAREADRAARSLLQRMNARHLAAASRRRQTRRPHRQLRTRRADAAQRARRSATSAPSRRTS